MMLYNFAIRILSDIVVNYCQLVKSNKRYYLLNVDICLTFAKLRTRFSTSNVY